LGALAHYFLGLNQALSMRRGLYINASSLDHRVFTLSLMEIYYAYTTRC
jgi:hypothetical protein